MLLCQFSNFISFSAITTAVARFTEYIHQKGTSGSYVLKTHFVAL